MFDFKNDLKVPAPRKSLYCVWFQAHDGENAPLVRVWIDPAMTMFDSQAKIDEFTLPPPSDGSSGLDGAQEKQEANQTEEKDEVHLVKWPLRAILAALSIGREGGELEHSYLSFHSLFISFVVCCMLYFLNVGPGSPVTVISR